MEPHQATVVNLIPALRMILSGASLKCGTLLLMDQLLESDPEQLSRRLGKHILVAGGTEEEVIARVKQQPEEFGEFLFVEGLGLLGLAVNFSDIQHQLAAVRKPGTGAHLPESVPLPQLRKPLFNKVIAVTGGGMGFGEGIARLLFGEGAHVVVMDINSQAGHSLVSDLNGQKSPNRSLFVQTDVSDAGSVSEAVTRTVLEFGGLDVMISNAGVLKAGSIDDMDSGTFDFVTRINYNGYFNCVKAAVPVMRAQNRNAPGNFGDIIQINSKSGLVGSKKNFAYAGSKFGGIGLTHSFAMDLMEDRIKVNSICPGNYFEGPLWSHPETGLFVQYLNTGKVPGATTIADVRRHYESMVPAGRGCQPGDVVKAIKYLIDQEYETGQALPVTGGQVMLS